MGYLLSVSADFWAKLEVEWLVQGGCEKVTSNRNRNGRLQVINNFINKRRSPVVDDQKLEVSLLMFSHVCCMFKICLCIVCEHTPNIRYYTCISIKTVTWLKITKSQKSSNGLSGCIEIGPILGIYVITHSWSPVNSLPPPGSHQSYYLHQTDLCIGSLEQSKSWTRPRLFPKKYEKYPGSHSSMIIPVPEVTPVTPFVRGATRIPPPERPFFKSICDLHTGTFLGAGWSFFQSHPRFKHPFCMVSICVNPNPLWPYGFWGVLNIREAAGTFSSLGYPTQLYIAVIGPSAKLG